MDKAKLGYHDKDGGGGNVSSWGSPVLFDEKTSTWHGWASEMLSVTPAHYTTTRTWGGKQARPTSPSNTCPNAGCMLGRRESSDGQARPAGLAGLAGFVISTVPTTAAHDHTKHKNEITTS